MTHFPTLMARSVGLPVWPTPTLGCVVVTNGSPVLIEGKIYRITAGPATGCRHDDIKAHGAQADID